MKCPYCNKGLSYTTIPKPPIDKEAEEIILCKYCKKKFKCIFRLDLKHYQNYKEEIDALYTSIGHLAQKGHLLTQAMLLDIQKLQDNVS